ncbi:glutathione-disulfide reductase [Candidatus Liberibacter americanus]|uniref:Dihydrolipoamide dehydrogenase/glutathione oxidoreductase n=1 Tax=Candidatus Liberibacter americanus str. Sao Paulo TaxID=1261131 RepID=U6B4W4_9HYPH|nr:glutathione-disulfide reductase [Candidatus Liberibacter americanus]AHA28109.1 Dihydrolipoamide dehydrogenase/glutathione oxidoreductase [Candidatus Liberibacter americanus str. Sao Paulo]EMS36044.1 glutathione reductase [Candidatus Liberibacter americanus PW_SP]
MPGYDYDMLVIGAGSAGVRAARLAAKIGKKVAICEEYRVGGTCVIRGCVPKKLMFYASQYSDHFEDAKGFGWSINHINFDWNYFISAQNRELARLESFYARLLDDTGVSLFKSKAIISSPHSVYLSNMDRTVTANYIVIATGGLPNRIDFEGCDLCITSEDIFSLESLPHSILIIGGGYIAIEFACILNSLGSKVTLITRSNSILSNFDSDITDGLTDIMISKGIRIINNDTIDSVIRESGKLKGVLKSGEIIFADQIMLAIGRIPRTMNIGIEKLGIDMSNGAIITDNYSRTNVKSIFALGDVTGRIQLTPVAIHAAACFIETEFKGNPTVPDYDLIPTAIFSHPEIGSVGLTEKDAANKFNRLEVYKVKYYPMKSALSKRSESSIIKIIVNVDDRKVIGVHILGNEASEIIQVLGICLKAGCTKDDFDRCMALHPTSSEELVTMYHPTYFIENGIRKDPS